MAYAACVVEYRESGSRASYRLNEEELKKVLGNKAISSKKVALISVAGAFRKGKSFLLNFLVLYLEWLSKGKINQRFFDENSSLEKFQWRGGVDRHTNGIYLWSEPYLLSNSNGEEVAVFLMDTQGTFDHKSTVQDCATIFSMSTLLSSIQIFNISSQIQEDDLNNLRLFTEYAGLACGQQERGERIAPFQKLLFLIRDWANSNEFPYGYQGGKKYLQNILETNDSQKKELRQLRRRLKKSFESMEAFLMPFPGEKIAFNNSTKILGEIKRDFAKKMEEFVPSLFDNLKAKTINGEEITCGALMELFKSYMAIFNSNSLPEPMTILDATASALNMAFEQKAKDFFDDEIKKNVLLDLSNLDLFEEIISAAIGRALTIFKNRSRIGEENAGDAHLANLKQYFQAQRDRLQAMVKQNALVKKKWKQMEKDRLKEVERIKNKERQLEEEQRVERERIRNEEARLKREREDIYRQMEERTKGGKRGPFGEGYVGPIDFKLFDINEGVKNVPGRKEAYGYLDLASVGVGNLARVGVGAGSKVGSYADKDGLGFEAEARYAKANLGPVNATLGLGVSSGIDTKDGIKAELLGTGLGVTSEGLEVKVLGSSVGLKWPRKLFRLIR